MSGMAAERRNTPLHLLHLLPDQDPEEKRADVEHRLALQHENVLCLHRPCPHPYGHIHLYKQSTETAQVDQAHHPEFLRKRRRVEELREDVHRGQTINFSRRLKGIR